MTRIILDDATCRQFLAVKESAEICDSTGRVLGGFIADLVGDGKLPPGVECPTSIEETEKLRGVRTGRTTEEILRGLGL